MIRTRVCLITAVLMFQFITACSGSQVGETQDEARVVIVAVNASDQYVEIRNDSGAPQNLTGWYLSLGRRTTCLLDNEIHLQPGETLRIWVLAQDVGKGGYNCGLDRPFWSSKEPERMFLYAADDQVMDSYFGGEG